MRIELGNLLVIYQKFVKVNSSQGFVRVTSSTGCYSVKQELFYLLDFCNIIKVWLLYE